MKNKQRLEAISHAGMLRAHLEPELNVFLYLSSGLGGYLVVRNDRIQPQEVYESLPCFSAIAATCAILASPSVIA